MMRTEKMSFLDRARRLIAPPDFADEEKNRTAALLNFLTLFYIFLFVFSFLSVFALGRLDIQRSLMAVTLRIGPFAIFLVIIQVMMRMGHVRSAASVFVVGYWINNTLQVFTNGGVYSPSFFSYLVAILVAGLFMGNRATVVTALFSFGAGIAAAVLDQQGRLPAPLTPPGINNQMVSFVGSAITVVGLLYLYLSRLNEAVVRLRQVNLELEQNSQNLEQRVAERTQALTLSAEISRRLNTILDLQQLTREVVDQIQSVFHFYHVHIYLFDDQHQNLVLAGGTGEAGRVMLSRGHKIPAGRGLVGRAATSNAPVLVGDTLQDPGWLPNPLLPDTRSELAAPISLGEQVLGVLDVQQKQVNGLTQADAQLIESIANQVAIAVQNARAYQQAQERADRESVVSAIGQRIQRATTIDEVLKVAVSELGQALGAQRASAEVRSQAIQADHKN